jgi:hypothetical protein
VWFVVDEMTLERDFVRVSQLVIILPLFHTQLRPCNSSDQLPHYYVPVV